MRRLPFVLVAAFAVLLVAGLLLGEYQAVLRQAVNLCLSCMGIG